MIYVFIGTALMCATSITFSIISYKERKELIKMLASRNYADYVHFNEEPEEKKDRPSMYGARENEMQKRYKILEDGDN